MLYIVSTPIGNLSDITLRALEILKQADLVLAEDTRVTKKIFNHYDINTRLISWHQHSELKDFAKIKDYFAANKEVVLVTDAGTPGISDPGGKLIEFVLKELFGEKAKIRFATTNFPFVEPGVDAYLGCTICKGKGCSFCKQTGWSEIMPAGMIHPFVLRNAGIDPNRWGGFAFAIGLSRIVNLRYKIRDLRTLTTPVNRILNQF